jgi:hypothetical protein
MKSIKNLFVCLLVGPFLFISACKKDDKNTDQLKTFYGPAVPTGKGTIRSFVVLNAEGKPAAAGIKFTASSLTTLPTEGVQYPLELPIEAKLSGFDHLEVDWNPDGHEPAGVYTFPHFDFHFYKVTKEEQANVIPGPDTVSVKSIYIPQDYVSGVVAIPDMGVHWVDSKAPEFTGGKFTDTFIYGFYHGQLTFLEPMITLAFLQTKPDFKLDIKQPQYFQKTGYYPSVSHVYYDAVTDEYTVALEGLKYAVAY